MMFLYDFFSKLFVLFVFLISSVQLIEAFPENKGSRLYLCKKNESFHNVKVLLDEIRLHSVQSHSWILDSPSGFILSATNNSQRVRYLCSQLIISKECSALRINGKKIALKHFTIKAHQGLISFKEKQYQGIFNIAYHGASWHLINQLNLEDYVSCVLHAESWPGWPIEVNKALAIACRSYVVSKILLAKKNQKPYHIKNTNIHQTYKGTHADKKVHEAVLQTKGLILTYKKYPIDAMFDSCCGGIIPAHLSDVDFGRCPYLARTYSCNYCKPCKIYSWIAEYTLPEFEKILFQAGYNINRIKKAKIIKDRAGIVKSLEIHGSRILNLSGKKVYSLLNNVKSLCMSVELKAGKIIFTGKGFGHHLGICQWGARRMLDTGKTYNAILNFYYPGTILMELKNLV